MTEPIRVTIIEDEQILRKGLSLLIEGTPGYSCVGAFGSVEEATPVIAGKRPDVLLLDIHLPGMLGSEAVSMLQQKCPPMQIVMLTVYDEEDKIFESICSGACGYLLKKTPPAELLH